MSESGEGEGEGEGEEGSAACIRLNEHSVGDAAARTHLPFPTRIKHALHQSRLRAFAGAGSCDQKGS